MEAPPLSRCLLTVGATCWRPKGGAQPDSLGSARLPGAAASTFSPGLSCSGNTTRNCNPSPLPAHGEVPFYNPPHTTTRAQSENLFQCTLLELNALFFILKAFVLSNTINKPITYLFEFSSKQTRFCEKMSKNFRKCVFLVSKPVSSLGCIE